MPTLIYIHGRGQKHTEAEEKKKWLDSLDIGLGRLKPQARPDVTDRMHLAYWSDLFYPLRGRSLAADSSSRSLQGLDNNDATVVNLLTAQYWAEQLPRRSPPPPPTVNPTRTRARSLRPDPGTQGRAAEGSAALSAAGAAPSTAVDAQGMQYEDGFVRDVVKYFALGYADRVRQPLVDLLTRLPLDDGAMVIAHSFGTIIAYEVLVRSLDEISQQRQAKGLQPLAIDTLVTMGGPLGYALDLQERLPDWTERAAAQLDEAAYNAVKAAERMRERLSELAHKLWPFGRVRGYNTVFHLGLKQFPPKRVERWFNIYDEHDPVSYPPLVTRLGGGAVTVGDTFLSNGSQRAFDIPIRNDFRSEDIKLIDPDAHNDRGYGQSAQLAQLVRDFWLRFSGPQTRSASRRR